MKHIIRHIIKLIGIGLIVSILPLAQANEDLRCYKIGVWDYSIAAQAATNIVEEIYQQNNLCYELINTSLEKAKLDILQDQLNANIWRSDMFIEEFKDQLIATDPLFSLDITLYINQERIEGTASFAALAGKTIGFAHGDVHAKREIENLNAIPLHGETYSHAVKGFFNRRYDAVAVPSVLFDNFIKDIPADMTLIELPIAPIFYRHVMHKNHSDIIKNLNKALVDALKKGTLNERMNIIKKDQN